MALGAFLAGLMLAGTEYRHQIDADIRPVRGILLGLFFISVGMLVDLRIVIPQFPQIGMVVALLVLAKATLLTAFGRLFRLPLPLAANAGLHLAQGGEFAFVLLSLAMGTAVLPIELGQFLLAVVACSMALTPLLASMGRKVQSWLEQRGIGGVEALASQAATRSRHVVIAGFGRVGRTVAQMLDARDIQWIAVDRDAATVAEARAKGLPVFFGDARQETITKAANLEEAKAAVVTLDDPQAAQAVLRCLKRHHPDLPVIVRARDPSDMLHLLSVGASTVVPEAIESSLVLGGAVLRSLGEQEHQIEDAKDRIRRLTHEAATRATSSE